MIIKTGIEIDTTNQFSNPTSFEENGAVSSINATGLTAETGYYVRAYVVDDQGNRIDGENIETFTTAAPAVNDDYFYIESLYTPQSPSDSNQITLHKNGSPSTGTTLEFSYDYDRNTWTTCSFNSSGNFIRYLGENQKIYFRSSDGFGESATNYFTISAQHGFALGGDLRTLLDYTNLNLNSAPAHCFRSLSSSSNLQSIDNLDFSKLTTVNACSYYAMFNSASFTYAPELPATTLGNMCYYDMFKNCAYLVNGPSELPATTLANYCYYDMFYGCSNLTTTPVLPATTLANYCYMQMFSGCTALNKVVTYAQDISATDCLRSWLRNVSSTGDFYNLGGATYPSGSSGIPTGWAEHASL